MKFTVELENETKIVVADRVKMEGGKLNFYNASHDRVVPGSNITMCNLEIVGSFGSYKNFYVNGLPEKDNE